MQALEWLLDLVRRTAELAQTPWFRLGDVEVSLALILSLIVVLFAVWFGAHGIERALLRAGRRRASGQASLYALSRILRYVVLTVGLLVGLNLVGIDLTTLAIVGGAVGIGIGLGLQSVFSNFVSGIILLVEQTLRPGDFVELESGVRGLVIEIGMRYTLIRTNSSVDVIVPNSEFTNGRLTSWTHGSQYRRLNVPFNVAYGSDKNRVREAGLAAAHAVAATVEDGLRRTDVWFTAFGDSSLEFALVVWVGPDAITRPGATLSQYLWALDDALRERGIEIPFPQRDLHFRSGRVAVAIEEPRSA